MLFVPRPPPTPGKAETWGLVGLVWGGVVGEVGLWVGGFGNWIWVLCGWDERGGWGEGVSDDWIL